MSSISEEQKQALRTRAASAKPQSKLDNVAKFNSEAAAYMDDMDSRLEQAVAARNVSRETSDDKDAGESTPLGPIEHPTPVPEEESGGLEHTFQFNIPIGNPGLAETMVKMGQDVAAEQTSLIVSDEQSLEIIPGFAISPSMSFADRKKMVQQITGMTGAPSENVDEYLGIPIPCLRVIMHPCSVRSKTPRYDRRSGEEYYPLEPSVRIVFQRADNTKMLAFVSGAIRGFVETYILPVFGPGPWEEPINIKFRQVSTSNGGRTYQAQVVE